MNEKKVNRQQTHYFHCDQIGIPREMTDIHGNIFQKNHGVTQKPYIINVHGPHIIFKGTFEHSPSMNIAFIRSRGIANKYDIPLNYDIKNINVNRE